MVIIIVANCKTYNSQYTTDLEMKLLPLLRHVWITIHLKFQLKLISSNGVMAMEVPLICFSEGEGGHTKNLVR